MFFNSLASYDHGWEILVQVIFNPRAGKKYRHKLQRGHHELKKSKNCKQPIMFAGILSKIAVKSALQPYLFY